MRPPPYPPPFPVARDEVTQPGIGVDMERLTLKRENMRLRQERNAAREQLTNALTSSAPGLAPRTRGQKAGKVAIELGKFAAMAPVLVIAGKLAAKHWPEFSDLIDAILGAFGL